MKNKDLLEENLKLLVSQIQHEIEVHTSKIEQRTVIHYANKILDFQYTDQGAIYSNSQGEYITQTFNTVSQDIFEIIKSSSAYSNTLQDESGEVPVDVFSLDGFINVVTDLILNETDLKEEKINSLIINFLKDVCDHPFRCSATVELSGIVIESEKIELITDETSFTLRQPNVEDLQKKYLIYPYLETDLPSYNSFLLPSAIVEFELQGNDSVEVQEEIHNKIQKIITILRLFEVSSIAYISYSRSSGAVSLKRKVGGRISTIKDIDILKKMQIGASKHHELLNFFKNISSIISSEVYELNSLSKDMAHLTLAYRHYCESLLSRTRLEEKITGAVIGLEALLLAENQEISFRFWVRGAKILSSLGYVPLEVKNNLKTAYNIRSIFVHGDDLELDKQLRKLNENYQEPKDFLVEILDYLRTLIIAMIFLSKEDDFVKISKGVKSFEKKKFLGIVDDSLIDRETDNQLNNLLRSAKDLISW